MNGQAFRERLGSQIITPDDPRYDSARRVWNGMIDRRPAAVVLCRGVADVIAAVAFARDEDLLVAIRGGGHNVAGFGTCDNGLVIDLSPMRSVRVEPATRRVRVGGGATMADLDRETQVFGLAVPGGIVSTTGVAGLTLGGGQGWLRRTHGMASESLVSADVVTAAGEFVTASQSTNADLFWALRGGGGNFGVVTSLEFDAYPVGPMIAFAGPCYPLESAAHVIAGMREFVDAAPDEVNVSATWWTIPASPNFPEHLHDRAIITLGAVYVGPPERGERILQPLREIEEPLLDLSGVLPYAGLQQMFDPFFPAHDLHYYWKSVYLADLGEEPTRTLAEHVAARPSTRSMVGTWALGGALGRAGTGAADVGGAPYLLEILANWAHPAEADANIEWVRTLFDGVRPYGTGRTNVNFPGSGDDAEFGRAAYGDGWDRLVEVKRKYDPTNRFRLNQNIRP